MTAHLSLFALAVSPAYREAVLAVMLFAASGAICALAWGRQRKRTCGLALDQRLAGYPRPGMEEFLAPQSSGAALERGKGNPMTLRDLELSSPLFWRLWTFALVPMTRQLTRLLPGGYANHLEQVLARAGQPWGLEVSDVLVLQLVADVVVSATALLLQVTGMVGDAHSPTMILVWSLGLGLVGASLPELWLRDRSRARTRAIQRGLADWIDILSISMQAGLGFDAAIERLCQKWDAGALAAEFRLYLAAHRLGTPRRDALRHLAGRSGVEDLNTFVGAIIQADQLGVSIAHTLRVQSEQLRVKRRQRAEKKAQEAPLKMLFPMILFIFPSVFVVILGPSVPQLMHGFTAG